MIYKRFIR